MLFCAVLCFLQLGRCGSRISAKRELYLLSIHCCTSLYRAIGGEGVLPADDVSSVQWHLIFVHLHIHIARPYQFGHRFTRRRHSAAVYIERESLDKVICNENRKTHLAGNPKRHYRRRRNSTCPPFGSIILLRRRGETAACDELVRIVVTSGGR